MKTAHSHGVAARLKNDFVMPEEMRDDLPGLSELLHRKGQGEAASDWDVERSCLFSTGEELLSRSGLGLVRDRAYYGGVRAQLNDGRERIRDAARCLLSAGIAEPADWHGAQDAAADVAVERWRGVPGSAHSKARESTLVRAIRWRGRDATPRF